MRIRPLAAAAIAATAVMAVAMGPWGSSADASVPWAKARLTNAAGRTVGTVRFIDEWHSSKTLVLVDLRRGSGVTPANFHGLHIHANDAAANGTGCVADPSQLPNTWFVSADGHWKHDPTELHGHHAGDLPSIYVNDDGSSELRVHVDKLTADEIVGRAVVLHAGADNFGNVPTGGLADQYTPNAADATTKTQNTGNAGDRVACGVVTR